MEVKIETFTAKGLGTGRDQKPRLYRVRVDGFVAGFIGWQPGAKLMFHKRYSPAERIEIEEKVTEQIAKGNPSAKVVQVESVTPPEAPEGFFKSKASDEDDLELEL